MRNTKLSYGLVCTIQKGVNTIKEVRDMTRDELVNYLAKRGKQLNQRFYRLEKKGLEKSSYTYQKTQKELGMGKPRYSQNPAVIARLSNEEIGNLKIDLDKKLTSSTTITGVKKIIDKRVKASLKKAQAIADILTEEAENIDIIHSEGVITESEWKYFLENGGGDLMNSEMLDSEQVIEDWLEYTKNGNVSTDDFVKTYNESMSKEEFELGDIVRGLKALNTKKSKKTNKTTKPKKRRSRKK